MQKKNFKLIVNKGSKLERKLPYGMGVNTFIKFKKNFGINKNLALLNFQKKLDIRYRFKTFIKPLKKNLGGPLKSKNLKKLRFFRKIKNYRFFRHKFKRSVRGQRTQTNAKTQKKIHRFS